MRNPKNFNQFIVFEKNYAYLRKLKTVDNWEQGRTDRWVQGGVYDPYRYDVILIIKDQTFMLLKFLFALSICNRG